MKIVDAVQVHILGVPGKRCLPAAEVKVSSVHPVDLNSVILLDIVKDRGEPLDVPPFTARVSDRTLQVSPVQRRHERDVLPVLPLQVLNVHCFDIFTTKGTAAYGCLLLAPAEGWWPSATFRALWALLKVDGINFEGKYKIVPLFNCCHSQQWREFRLN